MGHLNGTKLSCDCEGQDDKREMTLAGQLIGGSKAVRMLPVPSGLISSLVHGLLLLFCFPVSSLLSLSSGPLPPHQLPGGIVASTHIHYKTRFSS